jgi:hypothetical protein
MIGRCGASSQLCSDASDRQKNLSGSSLYSTKCHIVVRLVRQAGASGQGAQQRECALTESRVRVRSVLIGASGHLSTRVTSSLDRW